MTDPGPAPAGAPARPSSPHRPAFAVAALLWCVSALAWALVVGGLVPASVVAPLWAGAAHALVFALGPMPLFIAGFLASAGARWLGVAPGPARSLWPGVIVVGSGWAVVLAGVGAGPRWLAGGLLLCALGWTMLLGVLVRLRLRAGRSAPEHFDAAVAGCGVWTVCLFVAALAAATGDASRVRTGALVGLWWGVVPVFVVASHRLLPFLGGGWPSPLLRRWSDGGTWWMASGAAAAGGVAGWGAPLHAAVQAVLAVHAALLAATAWHLVVHWRRQRPVRAPLPAMLLRAFLWWAIAWTLLAVAWWPGEPSAWRGSLAGAALHALTLGWLGGTMLAMVTRVTVTQAGQRVAIDGTAQVFEAVLQIAVVARLLAALVPATGRSMWWAAAAAWALLATGWALRHGPALLRRG